MLLSGWLREPAIEWWWHDDPAPQALEERYGPSVDGTDPTMVLIASNGGEPIGLIQWYWLRDEPDFSAEIAAATPVPDAAVSIDYLIGRADLRGRGLGAAMIGAVLEVVWRAGASTVLVPVHARNVGSCAVLERMGFRVAADADLEPDNPAHDRHHLIYRTDRPIGAERAFRRVTAEVDASPAGLDIQRDGCSSGLPP